MKAKTLILGLLVVLTNLTACISGDKWGIINFDGDFVASPQFDGVGYSLVEYDYYSEINLK